MKRMTNRFILLVLAVPVLLIGVMLFGSTKPAHAAAVTGFNPGRIMDDGIFTKKGSMSAAQIQSFLNSKVPTCDTNGTQTSEYGGGTRAQYGASRGYPKPYICLRNYSQGGKSAARIIYDTAQEFSINPQVLIVLLQKEQGLVTDTWPWSIQYRSATGYGCPDTAACDSTYYGFTNQVRWSARMFRAILNQSPTWYTPYDLGNNRIYWNPDTARCGSSTVNIQNLTTVALYSYTPYRPNQSALNAGYGTGDSCGSYGNRNFYQYFKDWFGSPYASFKWYTTGYKVLDEGGGQYVDPGSLQPGRRYLVDIATTNTGQATWENSGPTPVRLGASQPNGRNSSLCDTTWITCSRPTNLMQNSVASGEIGNFRFIIKAPYQPGSYREYFKPLAESLTWMNDTDQSLGVIVRPLGSLKWENSGYKIMDISKSQFIDPGNLQRNQKYIVILSATNTGQATWENSGPTPVRLGASQPNGRNSSLCDTTWITCSRPTNLMQPNLKNNESGHFEFIIKTPSTPGSYREYFKPLVESYYWLPDSSEPLGIVVK